MSSIKRTHAPTATPPAGVQGAAPREVCSELSGFYRLPMNQRRATVGAIADLTLDELRIISGEGGLTSEQADHMVENAIGVVDLPLALCVNLRVNGRDWVVPMATEEASVVAAASHAAKLLRSGGGLTASASPPLMIGQIQILDVPDPAAAEAAVHAACPDLLRRANTLDPCLISAGGGAIDIEVRHLPPEGPGDPCGAMLVLHLIVDVRDAMGANTVNSMCEHLAPVVEDLTGGRVRLRIISNLADRRTITVTGRVPFSALEGKGCRSPADLAHGIEEASIFAERDPYRAATHNKGIMNGVDAVLVAFGQDWRAVEAGAHAFAARSGRYTALARWRVRGDALEGELEIPMPVGIVGGVTGGHPFFRVARRMTGITTATELAVLTAAVGLAQNLGALRALAAEGIQVGHMRAHARNMAVAVGAVGDEVEGVAQRIGSARTVNLTAARQALLAIRRPTDTGDAAQLKRRFESLRQLHVPRIMALIEEILGETAPGGSTLCEMCSYHLQTGGKRLRALLPLLVAESLGIEPDLLIPFGAACEMLHNATLVHDDIQDGDRMRRGQETVWHRFGMPQAINLGDAMFYYTLLLVQRLDLPAPRREAAARRVLHETLRVIDGQEREFILKGQDGPSLADYFQMVEAKTSGLFALPMAGGAELCGQPLEVVEGLEEAARHMGVLFQIQDDVLDLFGEKGRGAQGSDIREGKCSFLVVHALEMAGLEDRRQLVQILTKERDATSDEEVALAIDLLERTGSLQAALDEIADRRQVAVQVPALANHPHLQSVVEAMCGLFLEPIRPVMARSRTSTTGGGPRRQAMDPGVDPHHALRPARPAAV